MLSTWLHGAVEVTGWSLQHSLVMHHSIPLITGRDQINLICTGVLKREPSLRLLMFEMGAKIMPYMATWMCLRLAAFILTGSFWVPAPEPIFNSLNWLLCLSNTTLSSAGWLLNIMTWDQVLPGNQDCRASVSPDHLGPT